MAFQKVIYFPFLAERFAHHRDAVTRGCNFASLRRGGELGADAAGVVVRI
jgi:hypothetical protein